MTLNFSISAALLDSWNMFKKHWVFFVGLSFVMLMLNLFSWIHSYNTILLIIVALAAIVWSYVWVNVSLAAVDSKETLLTYKSLPVHMPSFRQFFVMVVLLLCISIPLLFMLYPIGILTLAITNHIAIAYGTWTILVLIFLAGVYLFTRLSFTILAYVDRQHSIGASLKYSWQLVSGKIFWTVFVVLLIEVVLVLVGSAFFLVGSFVTYPIAVLLVAHLYRALDTQKRQS